MQPAVTVPLMGKGWTAESIAANEEFAAILREGIAALAGRAQGGA